MKFCCLPLMVFLIFFPVLMQAQHPVTFFTKTETTAVLNSFSKYPLCLHSYIADGTCKPEVNYLVKGIGNNWFNWIDNHGVWACAGVCIVGIAADNIEDK